MNVRGWLIVGGYAAAAGLPPTQNRGYAISVDLPCASAYEPGEWILWQPSPPGANVCCVCVDLPLS